MKGSGHTSVCPAKENRSDDDLTRSRGVGMSKRLIKRLVDSCTSVKVVYDSEWGEYIVTPRWGHMDEDTYHTDDYNDALQTAAHMMQEMADRTSVC